MRAFFNLMFTVAVEQFFKAILHNYVIVWINYWRSSVDRRAEQSKMSVVLFTPAAAAAAQIHDSILDTK